MNETQSTWVDSLEAFLEGYGLPTTIASVVAIVVIIGIPTLVQIIRLMSAAKDNTAYRGIMLTRIASSTAYSKRVAEGSEKVAEAMAELLNKLSDCKRMNDVKAISKEFAEQVKKLIDDANGLVSIGEKMMDEYGSVPTKRALKEIEKAKKKEDKKK